MALDSVKLNLGAGGDSIGTDKIAGVDYELVKQAFGDEGVITMVSATNPLPVTDVGANATSQRVELATLPNNTDTTITPPSTGGTIGGHSIPFKLYDANANRKEVIVLNHGTLGSFHLYYGGSIPATGEFISPIELFYHDTWVADKYTGIIWAEWHEPEEKITTPVAVTLIAGTDLVTRTAHGLVNHSEVLFNTIVTTTGIIIDTIYYAIRVDANTFKLALTKADVRSNTPIDLLTGDGSGTITHSKAFSGFINTTEVTT